MKDLLITWLEESPMNARIFLEYDAQMPWWCKAIYRVRLLLGM
jgi:hypothetical protein